MTILGLDLAKTTGWGVMPSLAYGVIRAKTETPRDLAAFRGELAALIAAHRIGAVFSEAPIRIMGRPNFVVRDLRAVVMELCGSLDVAWAEINPLTLKKAATGSAKTAEGESAKAAMVRAANLKFGLQLTEKDHDMADALHLADLGRGLVRIRRAA